MEVNKQRLSIKKIIIYVQLIIYINNYIVSCILTKNVNFFFSRIGFVLMIRTRVQGFFF